MNRRGLALVALTVSLASAGCFRPQVLRASGGEVKLGRFIPGAAYEAYARGVVAEQDGRLAEAESELRAAAHLDEGPEAWARLGAVLCRLRRSDEAADAFARARELDADASITERELARCALAEGRAAAAVELTERAMLLDPSDDELLAIRADALAKSGAEPDALRLLLARVVAEPAPIELRRRLAALAEKRHDLAAARVASRGLESAPWDEPADKTFLPRPSRPSLAEVDAALVAGDRDVRSLGLRAGLPQGELALRACALGLASRARDLATPIAAADPSDAAAIVAALAGSDLAGDAPGVEALLRARVEPPSVPLSALGRLVLAELLARRLGPEAARAVALGDLDVERNDPLEEALRQRLRTRLGP